MSKYKVPGGMANAVGEVLPSGIDVMTWIGWPGTVRLLEAAIAWLDAQDELKPVTPARYSYDMSEISGKSDQRDGRNSAIAAIRKLWLAPEDPFERDCADIKWPTSGFAGFTNDREAYNEGLREAYERGRNAK